MSCASRTATPATFFFPKARRCAPSEANRKKFEGQRVELEARNIERRTEAEAIHAKLEGNTYVVIRSAGETGQLYGSVSARDIAEALDTGGFKVSRSQVSLTAPIKTIGMHAVAIDLHPEVRSMVTLNVARSNDEAERQARGEDLTQRDRQEAPPAEETPDVTAMFEKSEDAAEAVGEEGANPEGIQGSLSQGWPTAFAAVHPANSAIIGHSAIPAFVHYTPANPSL